VSRWACQSLEADLLQGVGEEPAPELDAVFGRASAGLEFAQHGFGAVDKAFLKVRLQSHSDRRADVTEGPSRAKSSNSPTWRISEQASDLERRALLLCGLNSRRCRCNGRSQTVGNRKKFRIARIGAPPGQADGSRVDLRGRRPANNADRLGTRQRRE
jgi:hypothetical protein